MERQAAVLRRGAKRGKARALYERLGFVTVWRQHAFVRQP